MLSAGSLAGIAIFVLVMLLKADRSQEWLAKANGFYMVSLVAMWLSLMDLMGSIGSLTGVMEMPIAIVAFLLWANNWRMAKNLKIQMQEKWAVVGSGEQSIAGQQAPATQQAGQFEPIHQGKIKEGVIGIFLGLAMAVFIFYYLM